MFNSFLTPCWPASSSLLTLPADLSEPEGLQPRAAHLPPSRLPVDCGFLRGLAFGSGFETGWAEHHVSALCEVSLSDAPWGSDFCWYSTSCYFAIIDAYKYRNVTKQRFASASSPNFASIIPVGWCVKPIGLCSHPLRLLFLLPPVCFGGCFLSRVSLDDTRPHRLQLSRFGVILSIWKVFSVFPLRSESRTWRQFVLQSKADLCAAESY